MLIVGISKRKLPMSGMISVLHHVFCLPTVCGKAFTVNRLSLLSIGTRSFCISASTEAQAALLNYLHDTRGIDFIEAEHISKNSPHFLQNLLSNVDDEHDVSRGLSKYFHYNAINEFEPFFESVGLNPHEIPSLLPRSTIFLADDFLMFDNFHVLCTYGIPRIKIGKMYKEAKEIFGYGHGILSTKLRAYEELGFSKSNVIKLVTSCPSLLIRDADKKFVVVLERLKRFGFGSEWVEKYVSKNSTLNMNRMLATMDVLMQVGYSKKQMEILLKNNPMLLFQDSGMPISTVVGLLLKLGLKMEQVFQHFLKSPQIMSSEHAENLWMAVSFLFEIGMKVEAIASIVGTHMQVLGLHSLKRPLTVMRRLKIQKSGLRKVIEEDPLELINMASKSVEKRMRLNSNTLVERRNFLLRLGHVENSEELGKALKQFRGKGDQLQERFDCLVKAGLDHNIVSSMIKRAPSVLNQSTDVLEKKIDCLRNYIGYPLDSVAAFPSYLCYDLQRINLRFSMYSWLLARGRAKPMLSLSTILVCSDKRFMKHFVESDPEGVAMWESLKTSVASSSG